MASGGQTRQTAAAENDDKRIRLRRMQWLANGLLLLAALVFALATYFKANHPSLLWLPYIAAFAEAAMVGALADWFAVVALFRHPLGLRFIPHTAIIPANKERIAANLGGFVQSEFFATERVLNVIREFDPAARIALWFAHEANAERFGDLAVRGFSYALNALNEDEVRNYLNRTVTAHIAHFDLAQLAGSVLDMLTLDDRHQALLDQLLEGVEATLAKPEVLERIEHMLANQLPLYFARLKMAGGRIAAEKIVAGILQLLHEINADPQHPLRLDFNRMVTNLIVKLKSDPDYRFRIEQFQRQLAGDARLSDYLHGLWQDFRQWLQHDLQRPDSSVRTQVAAITHRLAQALRDDHAMQQWINAQIIQAAPPLIEEYRPRIGSFITAKMCEWKDDEIVDKLELNIGRDLQFIRLNGTLVGGIVGLLIHVFSQWLGS
ncbi:MAG: DUF445 domain-containing protein [Glaciimonas sp.]|nr:DUF445 domain-containing protein [Glaciimonas sp.]